MSESELPRSLRLSECIGAVFKNATDTLMYVGYPQCRRIAPVHDDVISEHRGVSGRECSTAGLRVVDDRSDFVIGSSR
ncbi:hypothetical protein OHA40_19150 [Nocardia sp. NBC_00508]|uniref:hypothetical protein n=1 Tax=Nocardia sp. NBC_00508 TaxID=2975992 RepID=UPI002E807F8B|nr:hypothetical protein [Nocardia sp. NBC_00508]WUD63861.1 hypothetical protein OHA40_19150 [Nocardia sp. NBC_00508]